MLDRKSAGFADKVESLSNNATMSAKKCDLKAFALNFAVFANKRYPSTDRVDNAFSDFGYTVGIPYSGRSYSRFAVKSEDKSIWTHMFPNINETELNAHLKKMLCNNLSGNGDRQATVLVNWPATGTTDFTDDYSILKFMYAVYHSPFAELLLRELKLLMNLGCQVNIDEDAQTVRINGMYVSTQGLAQQLTALFSEILLAKPEDVETMTAAELEDFQIYSMNVMLSCNNVNYNHTYLLNSDEAFSTRVFRLLDEPLERGRADIGAIYTGACLLEYVLGNGDLLGAATANLSDTVFRFKLLHRINKLKKYSALLEAADVNNAEHTSLDIWSQALSDNDIKQAMALVSYAQECLEYILTSDADLDERIALFDEHFEVNPLMSSLNFHGISLGFTKMTKMKKLIREFLTQIQLAAQETIETTILPTMRDLKIMRTLVDVQEESMLIAYIKYESKTFDVWLDPKDEDGKQLLRLINPINNKEVLNHVLEPEVEDIAEVNGIMAKELSALFGKVVNN